MTRFDIVVAGGGLAGLSAATHLSARGARVLVLEARGGLGGRTTAFRDRATGEWVDNGQHVLLGCYRETFAWLRLIGAESHVRLQRQLRISSVDPAGRLSVLLCPELPSPLHLVAAVLDWDALRLRDRLSVLKLGSALLAARRAVSRERLDPAGRSLPALPVQPGETAKAWLERHGQSRRLQTLLWEPLGLAAMNQDLAAADAAYFVRVLAGVFGPDPSDAAIGLPTRPLHEAFAQPARRFIEAHGGEVRLNSLARIRIRDRQVCAVDVRGGDTVSIDRAVAAVPWKDLGALFPDDEPALARTLDAAAATPASPIVTVNLWLDRPVLPDVFVGLPGRALQWAFDKRWVIGDASHVSMVASGAAATVRMDNGSLAALAHRELVEAVPDVARARLERTLVVREPAATFSLAPGLPPRPPVETAVRGLVLAGDWVDTGLPATIEGAVLAGRLAADALSR